MNKDIDLTEILKNCPRGTKFYSYIFGEDTYFMGVSSHQGDAKPIFIYGKYGEGQNFCLTRKGHAYADNYGECCIFPSKDQRDWSKFTAPWVKKESDDEKIKNAILNHLKKMWGNCQDDVCGVHVEDAIDWLEKQGEPKFKIGDWVVRGETIAQILDIQEQYYVGLDINGKDFVSSRFLNDDKIHLWTIQNVKDGDVLVNGSNIFIFHFINNRRLMEYCHVNMDDGNFYNNIGRNERFCTIDAPVIPATKEQRDALMNAMNDAGYEWDVEKKELKKKEKFNTKWLKLNLR